MDEFPQLNAMIYSGRGITVGMTPDGNPFIGYTLTGRSTPSQARRLKPNEERTTIATAVTDPKQLEEGSPALLIYPALASIDDAMVASNGAQTKLLFAFAANNPVVDGEAYGSAMMRSVFAKPVFEYDSKDGRWIDITTYEPDPSSTPRISACVKENNGTLHIARRVEGMRNQQRWDFELAAGSVKSITTYTGDNESPLLLPFRSEPLEGRITSMTPRDIAQSLYGSVQSGDYHVAAAVMMRRAGRIESYIINKHGD